MADFDTLESSVEESRPVEIYHFALGVTSFRYTSADAPKEVDGETYALETISRSAIAQGADERNRNTIITVPSDNAFAVQYRDIVPSQKASVSIIRVQRDESPLFDTQALIYKGQIQSVRFPQNGHTAEIVCRSLEAAAGQMIPRYSYMSMCNHLLYGPGCGVNSDLFNVIGAASSISANTLVVAGLAASGLNVTGGYVTPTVVDDFRMILEQSGDTITLLLPFTFDVTGQNVQVFAGCDHKMDGHCATIFDNVKEFGGFAFVPSKNIFVSGLD